MQRYSKIDDIPNDQFIKIFNESNSFNSILKKLEMSHGRSSQDKLKAKCEELKLDTSKFKRNGGGKIEKMDSEEIFVENSPYTSSFHLNNRIRKENLIEYKCAICGNSGEWNNSPLSLQLDHINGNHKDNRLSNLRFLCPNCHSQTDTYCSKRRAK